MCQGRKDDEDPDSDREATVEERFIKGLEKESAEERSDSNA